MSERLQGKVAVVTGGASGMGASTVRRFAAEGARVLLTDLNVEAGQRLADELGEAVTFIGQDVSDAQSWQTLAAHIEAQHGRLDVLVNNAGILKAGSVEDTTLEDWQRLVAARDEFARALVAGKPKPLAIPTVDGTSVVDRINNSGINCRVPLVLLSP